MHILLIPLLAFAGNTVVKEPPGVFLTADDFIYNRVADSAATAIKPHHLFSTSVIDVISNRQRKRYCKDSVYGYRDMHGNVFRFYNGRKEYQLIEYKTVVIYSLPEMTGQGKLPIYEDHLFFSKTPDEPLYRLTVLNLKRIYPSNFGLHHFLDLCASDKILQSYNAAAGCYNANLFLEYYTTR